MDAGALRGAPAALARHDLVFAVGPRPHHDGLQQALLANRVGKIVEIGVGKMLARIVGTGMDQFDRHMAQAADVLDHRRLGGVVPDQCGKAAAQSFLLGLHHVSHSVCRPDAGRIR